MNVVKISLLKKRFCSTCVRRRFRNYDFLGCERDHFQSIRSSRDTYTLIPYIADCQGRYYEPSTK